MKRFAKVLITLSLAAGATAVATHVDPITETIGGHGTHAASAPKHVDPITETVEAAHARCVDPITETFEAAAVATVDPITE